MLFGFLLAAAAIGFALARYFFKDNLSALGLFCVAWFVPLALATLRLSVLQDPFSDRTWLMVLGSAASFIAGHLLFLTAYAGTDREPLSRDALRETIDSSRLRKAMVALFILTVVSFGYEVRVAGNAPIFVDASMRTVAYRNFALPFVHYGTITGIGVAILAFFHLWVFRRHRWLLPAALFVAASAIIVAILARQQILLIAFGCLMVANYTARRPISFARLAGFGALMLLLFLVVGTARSGDADLIMEASGTYVPAWAKGLVPPYLYLALNFQVLQSLAEAGLPSTLGAHTLQPILSLTLTRRLFPLPSVEDEYGWFNTYTYLWPLYSDFGVAGTLIVPFIYGVLSAWVYGRLRRAPSPAILFAYVLVAFSLVFVFQGNGFGFPMYYILAAEAWLVFRFARRPAIPEPALTTAVATPPA